MRFSGGRKAVLLTLLGLAAVLAVVIGITVGAAIASVQGIEEISRSADNELALPTVLYDRDGEMITELFSDEKRNPVSIEEIPRHVIYALVTREDRAFFEHQGFNFTRLVVAGLNTVVYTVTGGRAGVFSGASTITQQLAKMMYTDQSVTIRRKLIELWWALQLERHLTKYEILEEYLNRMPFGHGTYGIEAASQFYFGHGAEDLSIAESMMLVLQLSSPGNRPKYSPFVNPENARDQQRRQLDEMVALGYATQEEVEASFGDYWANHDYTRSASTGAFLERLDSDRAPWFSEHVRIQLETELLLGAANVFTDGYHVYTTLDLDYQEIAQEELWTGIQRANETYRRNKSNSESRIDRFLPMVEMLALGFGAENMRVGMSRSEARAEIYFRDDLAPLLDMVSMMFDTSEQEPLRQITQQAYLERQAVSDRTRVEGALITLANDTGYVLAMVGGSPFEGSKNETNRAVDAYRPPGSSFKPLYYSAGINNGTITPATVYQDIPISFTNTDGTAYTPSNYNGEWNGPTRVRYALATSMNVVSIRVLKDIGFTEAFNVAGRLLGLSEAQMAQRGFQRKYPVGLGTVSVSPILMARAFATFPSGGREVWPTSIRYIEDREGRTILEPAKDAQLELSRKGRSAQIISPQAAYIMTSMLQSTVEYGTLRNRRVLVGGFDDMAMAGKTGTTQNWSDAWTVGFSPYMTTAVWLGFDRGGSNSLGTNQTGAQTAGPIWAWYMKRIHEDLAPREFQRPPDIVERTVAARTGLLPAENYEGSTVREVFIAGTQPIEFDSTEEWENERRNRITGILGRSSSAPGGAAGLRDRIDSLGVFGSDEESEEEDTEDDSEQAAPASGSGLNPFLTTPDEPAEEEERAPVNPFFITPVNPSEDDEDADDEEPESNPMLD